MIGFTSAMPSSNRSGQVGSASTNPPRGCRCGGFEDERLDVALEAHPAEDEAGTDREHQPEPM